MNYRHVFHAGNICDVVKHAVLSLALGYLRNKDKGFFVLDTHSGTGLYDLADERARKTGEAAQGILKLLASPRLAGLADYYRVLDELNPAGTGNLRFYPGSPAIARHLMRPQDRLVACELHEEDAAALRRYFRHDKQAQMHHRDGYEALNAFLPPPEKRGLALIDPPFEDPQEFARLAQALVGAHGRWPQGIYMAWYPVKERPAVWRFHEALGTSGIPGKLCAEFVYREEIRHDRLIGCGLFIVNAPWKL
ncbi:MAG: 23S rRNA (adenine(2030)-N(6))-methyltransferase RlmJ, partial [Bdellovibrionales bacterium]